MTRKLAIVKKKYRKSFYDYERYSLLAIGSMYGVDIQKDNTLICQERLYKIWDKEYKAVCKKECNEQTRKAAKFILSRNIVCGNALSLLCVDESGNDTDTPIVFSEWTFPFNDAMMHRKDYTFDELLNVETTPDQQSFVNTQSPNDGEGKFLQEYISHYRRLGEDE